MKFMKYILIAVLILSSSVSDAQIVGTQRIVDNYWFPTNKKIKLGSPNAEIYYNGSNLVLDVTTGGGKVSIPDGILGNVNGIVGDATPAAGNFTSISASGSILSTQSTSIGWSRQSGANTACTTTCTSACVFGQNTADSSIVDCAAATADVCICAGAN